MSALTVYQGLEECFKRVDGLQNIQLGEPTEVHATPCLWTVLDHFERKLAGVPPSNSTITEMIYYWLHRFTILWQDNAAAYMELITCISKVAFAISEDPHLGGRLSSGMASITRGDAGFIMIGKTKYLVMDFATRVIEKEPRSAQL